MAINFPNSPSPNQQYTYDNKTWEWNGTYWEVYSALTSYITSAYTVGNGVSDISGVTGGNIALKSFSGVNITIVDGGDKLTFSGYPQQNVVGFYLPLSGGTVTGGTIFQSGLTSNTVSATTYNNLPVSAVTNGTGISASTSNGVVTITNTAPDQTVTISGGTGITTGGTYPNFTITNSSPDQTVTISGGTGITTGGTYPNFTLVNSAPDLTVTISGGTGITTGGTYPNFTITNSSPDQTVTITGGTNIQITGTYPNFGVNFTGGTILKYYVSASTPTGIINDGDRWFNTTDGVELVYVTDGDGSQWVQPNNGGSNTGSTGGETITLVAGSDPSVESGMYKTNNKVDLGGTMYDVYKINARVRLPGGTNTYVNYIGLVTNNTSTTFIPSATKGLVNASDPTFVQVQSPLGVSALVYDETLLFAAPIDLMTINNDNTLGGTNEYYIFSIAANTNNFSCDMWVDYEFLVPENDTLTFSN